VQKFLVHPPLRHRALAALGLVAALAALALVAALAGVGCLPHAEPGPLSPADENRARPPALSLAGYGAASTTHVLGLARFDVERELGRDLADVALKVEALERRAVEAPGAGAPSSDALERVRARLGTARHRLAELRAASDEKWPRARNRFDAAMHRLHKAVKRACS